MDNNSRKHFIYECLSCLPEKMVSVHGTKNLSEFLLHELSGESVFNLNKAAYFVDNPDFDTLKGVAGYNKSERCSLSENIWNQPELFTDYMSKAQFNNTVRGISRPSIKRSGQSEPEVVKEIATYLSLKDPILYTWNMKHDNHGMLLVEYVDPDRDSDIKDSLKRGAFFLALCPVR